MRFDPDGPVVILSAHLGDAACSCYHPLTVDGDVLVVNLFAGSPPTDSQADLESRIREDVSALARLGRHATYLGFLRDTYRAELGDPAPGPDQLLAELDSVIGAASLVLAPLGAGRKPSADRLLARRMAIELLYGWAGSDPIDAALYADFPAVLDPGGGWPTAFAGIEADAAPGIPKTSPPPRWIGRIPREVRQIDPLFDPTRWLLDDAAKKGKADTIGGYEAIARDLAHFIDDGAHGLEVAIPLVAR